MFEVSTRRHFLSQALALPLSAALSTRPSKAAERQLRFSYQLSSTLLTLIKRNQIFEKKFGPLGYDVSWHLFGKVLEPMNARVVDFHADVADAVPIFTQAAGAQLTLYAKEDPSPTAEAILVHADSPIQSVGDLKGKVIGVSKGSGCHFLLATALKREGLGFHDIKPAYLESADGNAAFQRRSIDAWVIWDPFLAISQAQTPTRIIADATGFSTYCRYYLVDNSFVAEHPDIVQSVFETLVETGNWVKANAREAAEILGPLWGNVPPSIVETVNQRRSYQVKAVDSAALADQQKIADTFFEAGLIPTRIAATEAHIWQPMN
jgi:sulfonate transport system substrate-binding protein